MKAKTKSGGIALHINFGTKCGLVQYTKQQQICPLENYSGLVNPRVNVDKTHNHRL
jgi:hypothetical protein